MRLALLYLFSFLVVLLAFAAGTFYAMRTGIIDEFDRDLKLRFAGIESFLDAASGLELTKLRHELNEHGQLRPGGELLQISDRQGEWIFQSESMKHLQIGSPAGKVLTSPVFTTVGDEDAPVRLGTVSFRSGDKQFIIQLGQSLEESSELIEQFEWIFLAAIPIVLLVACALGYWMAGRALRPVTAITEDARAISALDISKRIAVPVADDELRRLSLTLNDMMDRLETSFNKINQFTADASHELRTPIAIIRTTAELAVADGSPEASAQAFASILEESERTTRLLEDLLVLARSDSNFRSRLEKVDLKMPFAEAASQGQLLAIEKGVSISVVQAFGPCFVDGNSDLLRRLFLTLMDNAVKYTPQGGKIMFTLAKDKNGFRAEVADGGVGISSEDLPHIFERFYRADKARNRAGGVGLGLSIAEWIARVHHARIEVTSELDVGTTFLLHFHPSRRPDERQSDRPAPATLTERPSQA